MLMKFQTFSLGISLFLSGLYGGTGFFTIMGGNPAVARLSERGFAEYWQQVDSFMGTRMPVFGPILLLSLLTSVITLSAAWRSVSFWLALLALIIIISDIIFTLSTNHPLNQLIQSWDLQHLPSNVKEVQAKVVYAFWFRSFFMIASFACVVLAFILNKIKVY